MYNERIKKLQERLVKDNLKSYIIKYADPHLSEYVAERYKAERNFYCPFTGSNGTLLITQDKAYLYTDGRYFLQAERELEGTDIKLVKENTPGVLPIQDFLRTNSLYPVGVNISLLSNSELSKFQREKESTVYDVDYSVIIPNIPSMPLDTIWPVNEALLSESFHDRVNKILTEIKKMGADCTLISSLDDVAYVLGCRGSDIPYTPVFYSFLYLDIYGNIDLFIDPRKLPESFYLKINYHNYDSLYAFLEEKENNLFSIDPERTNARIVRKIKNKVFQTSPAYLNKSVKGEVEIRKSKEAQAYDGLKFVKLQKFIDDNIATGNLDEYTIARYIDKLRKDDYKCFSNSFETIVGVDSNSALMHYAPPKEGSKKVTEKTQVILVDSGGHYHGGTTDITRTFIVNANPHKDVINDYTLTLKSNLALSKVIFQQGCTGQSLDLAARSIMWNRGLDYKCGTGHGVGYMLCVHEGPISFKFSPSGYEKDAILKPGHIITDEPGVYKEGRYGIRLENELLVRNAFKLVTEEEQKQVQGTFYSFETITYVPFDIRGINIAMLTDEELEMINKYHERVCNILLPLCDTPELASYLRKITIKLTR